MISALNQEILFLMEQALIPGLSIVVIRNGEIFWHQEFGVKNQNTCEPVTNRTIFEAASTSKPVFAYAVLKLVERGLLELDRPLIDYAPVPYLEKVWGEYNTTDERFKQITPKFVLTHSTGFPNWLKDRLYFEFNPGERWGYSGSGFVLLGTVIERLTGKRLEIFIHDEVLKPLGMEDSWFVWRDEFEKHAADRHNFLGRVMPRFKYEKPLAAGSLYTTARDFAKFLVAILNNTGLSNATAVKMLEPQINVSRNGKEIEGLFWGLGFGLHITDQGITFWHWGDNGDCQAYFEVSLDRKVGFVYFANSSNGLSITDDVLKIVCGNGVSALTKFGGYSRYDSPKIRLYNIYVKKGANAAAVFLGGVCKEKDSQDNVTPEVICSVAREAKSCGDYIGALAIAEVGVRAFPESSVSNLCLGEAFHANNDLQNARRYIKKSVELDPQNSSAIEMLEKLE